MNPVRNLPRKCWITCVNVFLIIRRCTATFTTWKQHRQSPPPIVWLNMIRNVILISLLQATTAKHLTTPTAPICLLAILQIFLMHWMFRTNCRPDTPQEPYSMHSWASVCLTGKQPQSWYAPSHPTINCRTIPFHPPTLYVKTMVISAGK